jgi:predicted nucleic acid-binding protein
VTWVVDASVALKWVIPEVLSEQADRVLATDAPLLAPDLLMVEAANVLWKKTRRRELTAAEAERALAVLSTTGLAVSPAESLVRRAHALAQRLGHPVYDCVYLALAERERAAFVTADERLLGRARRSRMRIRIVDLRTF